MGDFLYEIGVGVAAVLLAIPTWVWLGRRKARRVTRQQEQAIQRAIQRAIRRRTPCWCGLPECTYEGPRWQHDARMEVP